MDFPTSQPDVGLVGGVFVDENPATGQPGSRIPASWGNQVTQEIKAVIEAAAIAPSDQASDQLVEAIQKLIAESTADTGGMPRFTAYLWTGRGDAMPEDDSQSSGQQLLDLMYPTMRADVLATQFYCTEAEWQAAPYKRVTHWSLGDGVSWMRPPDKNGVQPGNVGAFYGVGSNPAGALLGKALIDAMRNVSGRITNISRNDAAHIDAQSVVSGAFKLTPSGGASKTTIQNTTAAYPTAFLDLDASAGLPAGTTTDPIAGEFRPRTWYGIWMIRMYGRITNAGDLNAPALNARMDMIDARVSALESGSSSITKNGFKIHPDGEIEQWGVLENVNLGAVIHTVTYPIPFPKQVFNPSVTFAINGAVDGSTTPVVIRTAFGLSTMQVVGDGNALVATVMGDIYWRVKGK